jgi:hypothetical protein
MAAAAQREIHLSGLNPAKMAQWVRRNLIGLLNDRPSAASRRITEIVDLIREGGRLAEESRNAPNENAYREKIRQLNRVLDVLNIRLAKYKARPEVMASPGSGAPLMADYRFSRGTKGEQRERMAIGFAITFISMVHRIRRCQECRAWFFAITEHQKYCGNNCRQRHASQSEVFKLRRARYMREKYRPAQKEQDSKVKKLLSTELKGH